MVTFDFTAGRIPSFYWEPCDWCELTYQKLTIPLDSTLISLVYSLYLIREDVSIQSITFHRQLVSWQEKKKQWRRKEKNHLSLLGLDRPIPRMASTRRLSHWATCSTVNRRGESINHKRTYSSRKCFIRTSPNWMILPFLTTAQGRHVQISVM